MKAWKTLDSEYIVQSPFGNVRRDKCELPNGNIIDDFYVNEYSDWVNAIVITKEKKVVLVKQYRQGAKEFFAEIPGGMSEEGETYEAGILREVQEETGFTSDDPPVLLGEFMVNPAEQNNKVHTFLISNAYPAFQQHLDENEDIEIEVIELDSLKDRIEQGKLTQLFTVTAYSIAVARGLV
ncbi:NUDIX hydrolase [Pontibacillus yanchengensis]|uniref:DNA mismatch repair protein MutT n=1 Tax=Pontibacillus yanchengensis Y32 TaxID=1385514 RepID=A0A0A2TD73_9BACI|nr:NUDIX hydrolase [Pontibacillus yanchengensis]KGP72333.1 DNA mismatch repair protein MutT [Pontibacillus yanchengensis Y32]